MKKKTSKKKVLKSALPRYPKLSAALKRRLTRAKPAPIKRTLARDSGQPVMPHEEVIKVMQHLVDSFDTITTGNISHRVPQLRTYALYYLRKWTGQRNSISVA